MHQRQHPPPLSAVVLGRRVDSHPACSHSLISQQRFHLQTLFQVSEWAVDFGVQGGTDQEGWQYAADFPAYATGSGQNQHGRRRV